MKRAKAVGVLYLCFISDDSRSGRILSYLQTRRMRLRVHCFGAMLEGIPLWEENHSKSWGKWKASKCYFMLMFTTRLWGNTSKMRKEVQRRWQNCPMSHSGRDKTGVLRFCYVCFKTNLSLPALGLRKTEGVNQVLSVRIYVSWEWKSSWMASAETLSAGRQARLGGAPRLCGQEGLGVG